jgi:hypothetical protein
MRASGPAETLSAGGASRPAPPFEFFRPAGRGRHARQDAGRLGAEAADAIDELLNLALPCR